MAAPGVRSLEGPALTRHLPGIPVPASLSSNSTLLRARATTGSQAPPAKAGSSSVPSAPVDSRKGRPLCNGLPEGEELAARGLVDAAAAFVSGAFRLGWDGPVMRVCPAP